MTVPCSEVGHYFRFSAPYGVDTKEVHRNLKRALIWMEGAEDNFYRFYEGARDLDLGNMSARLEFRDTCRAKTGRDYSWSAQSSSK